MTEATLQEALIKALAEMPNPTKNADNPAFKRSGKVLRYADLEATLEACKPVLAKHGIALMQMPVNGDSGEIGVHTILIGHGEERDCGTFVLPMEGLTPQKGAGAITYARRYALTALFGLAQEDDDGNASSEKPKEEKNPASEKLTKAQAAQLKAEAKGHGFDTARLADYISGNHAIYGITAEADGSVDLCELTVKQMGEVIAAMEKAAAKKIEKPADDSTIPF